MSHLADASRALEIADAQLIAIQSRLSNLLAWDYDSETEHRIIDQTVKQMDNAIIEVRSAALDITKHDCNPRI